MAGGVGFGPLMVTVFLVLLATGDRAALARWVSSVPERSGVNGSRLDGRAVSATGPRPGLV
jgi:hypothetical protein